MKKIEEKYPEKYEAKDKENNNCHPTGNSLFLVSFLIWRYPKNC